MDPFCPLNFWMRALELIIVNTVSQIIERTQFTSRARSSDGELVLIIKSAVKITFK